MYNYYYIIPIIYFFLHVRSSRPEVVCKKDVLKRFSKIIEKCQCQGLFLNKNSDIKDCNFNKKRLWHRCFPVNFAKFLRTPFLLNTSGGCFLHILLFLERFRGIIRIFPKIYDGQCCNTVQTSRACAFMINLEPIW